MRRIEVTQRILIGSMLVSLATMAAAQSAPPSPQPISRAAYLQQIDKRFAVLDANKDGFADKTEIEVAETKAIGVRKSQLLNQREAAFKKLDTNNDGMLSLTEFNAALVAQPLPKANAAPVLNRLDTNKDGKISLAEHRAPAAAGFDRLDTNKDGLVSESERKARAKTN